MGTLPVAGVALALVAPLMATTIAPTDLTEAVAASQLIVRGRVVDTRSFVNEADGAAYTAVTAAVSATLKGEAESHVTFLVHGGIIGRYQYKTIGAPEFHRGDEAYMFLRAARGQWWPVGMSAGVYRVSPATGSPSGLVHAPIVSGVTATADAQLQRGDARRKPMAPAEFESLVRLVMRARAAATERGR
jgi:hypothetical protein